MLAKCKNDIINDDFYITVSSKYQSKAANIYIQTSYGLKSMILSAMGGPANCYKQCANNRIGLKNEAVLFKLTLQDICSNR